MLEHECADAPHARADLLQLRALCDSADADAFAPVSRAELTDQRAPAFVLQLGAIVQAAVDLAVSEGVLHVGRLQRQASWERIGRYVQVLGDTSDGAGAWFGTHFGLWKTHGTTPLWLVFYDSDWGRAQEVRPLIEPWATQEGLPTATSDDEFAVALGIPEGEEKDGVVRSLVDDLKAVATVLEALPPQTGQDAAPEEDDETSP